MISDDVVKSFFEILPPLSATLASIILPIVLFRQSRQEKKLESVKKTGELNHALGNSAKGAQLKLTALALDAAYVHAERVAKLTGQQGDKDAATAAGIAANEAHKLYDEHERRQAEADAQTVIQKEN